MLTMQINVGCFELIGDPRAFLIMARNVRACANHAFKRMIERHAHAEVILSRPLFEALFERG